MRGEWRIKGEGERVRGREDTGSKAGRKERATHH